MDDFEKNELNINETPSENEKRPDDVQAAQTDAAQTTPAAETPESDGCPTDRSRDMLTTRKRANAMRSAQDPNPTRLRDSLRITDRIRLTARPHRHPHSPRATNIRTATVSRRPITITAANTVTAELPRTERIHTPLRSSLRDLPKNRKRKKSSASASFARCLSRQ